MNKLKRTLFSNKSFSLKNIILTVVLTVILGTVGTITGHFNQLRYSGADLSFGWKSIAYEHACEVSNNGNPILDWRSDPHCNGMAEVNNLAFVLNILIIITFYLGAAALIVYIVSFGKRELRI